MSQTVTKHLSLEDSFSSGTVGSCNMFEWQPLVPLVEKYYPTYTYTWTTPSNIEKAYKVAQVLMDMKLVKVEKVKDFIELVNRLAGVL